MPVHTDKRASPRVPAKVAVTVAGRDAQNKPIQEQSETLLVNDGGALMALAAEFRLHDRLRITNQMTGGSVDARVAWRSSTQISGRWSYGIALIDPPENFWGTPR
jgi:hypothetical protein